jgi:hypothetical protein
VPRRRAQQQNLLDPCNENLARFGILQICACSIIDAGSGLAQMLGLLFSRSLLVSVLLWPCYFTAALQFSVRFQIVVSWLLYFPCYLQVKRRSVFVRQCKLE